MRLDEAAKRVHQAEAEHNVASVNVMSIVGKGLPERECTEVTKWNESSNLP